TIRGYKTDLVPSESIRKILEAGRWAPSGANTQPWEFLVVTKKDLREKITKIFLEALASDVEADPTFPFADKSYMKDVPAFIFVIGDPRLMKVYPKPHPKSVIWIQSIAASIQNMLLVATALNLGAAWITISRTMERRLKKLLKIPEQLRVINVLPIGVPLRVPEAGHRKPLNELVHHEIYDQERFQSNEQVEELISSIKENLRKVRGSRMRAAPNIKKNP
ncbi:MAG: nitroreductase family protein, partial [Candidatus Hodarchaeota archaeon]